MAGFEHATDEELTIIARNIREGAIRTLDKGQAIFKSRTEKATPEATGFIFSVTMVLPMVEAELRNRGFDVSSPVFGPDVLAAVIREMGADYSV